MNAYYTRTWFIQKITYRGGQIDLKSKIPAKNLLQHCSSCPKENIIYPNWCAIYDYQIRYTIILLYTISKTFFTSCIHQYFNSVTSIFQIIWQVNLVCRSNTGQYTTSIHGIYPFQMLFTSHVVIKNNCPGSPWIQVFVWSNLTYSMYRHKRNMSKVWGNWGIKCLGVGGKVGVMRGDNDISWMIES